MSEEATSVKLIQVISEHKTSPEKTKKGRKLVEAIVEFTEMIEHKKFSRKYTQHIYISPDTKVGDMLMLRGKKENTQNENS